MAGKMARPVAVEEGVMAKKDFALAERIFHNDIQPAATKAADYMQELSTAYKALKKDAGVQTFVARFVFKLDEMEESQRDDALRCLAGMLAQFKLYMPRDLVDVAEGKAAPKSEIIPEAPGGKAPKKTKLATMAKANLKVVGGAEAPPSDGTETDLLDAAHDAAEAAAEEPFEASAEELARQEGRGSFAATEDDEF